MAWQPSALRFPSTSNSVFMSVEAGKQNIPTLFLALQYYINLHPSRLGGASCPFCVPMASCTLYVHVPSHIFRLTRP